MRWLLVLCLALLAPAAAAVEVLASIRPLALIAVAVTGQPARVHLLVPPGASSHHYQLRPADRLALARADQVLWVGPAHEQFLARLLTASPRLLTVQHLPGLTLRPQRRPDGSGILPGTVDAHLWLDPDNAVRIARALAEALAAREPAQAASYRRNAAAFATRLAALTAREAQRFQGLRMRSYLAYHDAYQYLEPTLGLNFRGSLLAGDESRPGAKHFLLMAQRIRQEGLFCLLGEPGFDQALARHVFNDRAANLHEVDELFSQAPFDAGGYERGLAQLSQGIYHCLGGR